jgi:hypothetical protein
MRIVPRTSGILLFALLGALLPSSSEAGPELLSVSSRSAWLRTIDAADGSTMDRVVITLSGEIVLGSNGLARNPQTGTLYAILKLLGVSTRELVTLDPDTGVATSVGNTGDKFAAITFASDGTLYGMTGDGAAVPQALYTLSTVDAAPTFLTSFGAPEEGVTDGEALAFNPADGLLYRASGIGPPNTAEIFETIEPGTLAVVNVPLSGFDYEELTALAKVGGGFYAGDLGDALVDIPRFFRITTGGNVTFLGNMDHVTKGLVPVQPFGGPVAALSNPLLGVLAMAVMFIGCAGLFRSARRSTGRGPTRRRAG